MPKINKWKKKLQTIHSTLSSMTAVAVSISPVVSFVSISIDVEVTAKHGRLKCGYRRVQRDKFRGAMTAVL